ncbi:MAG: P-II family nitrogen regulator [Magnetococcales bacterium]|nr:P-II family nitrogen regulator [Magnetococcales bacterium]
MKFKMVIIITASELADQLVDIAKKAGATGATIVPGRGTGIHEALTFFGLSLDSQRSIILTVVSEACAAAVLYAVREEGNFKKPGTGIAFSFPLDHVLGMESQIAHMDCDMPDEPSS